MRDFILRTIKRLSALIPGLLVVYLAVNNVFPFLRRHDLPVLIAILVTWALTAYVFIPTVARLWHLVWPAKHLPLYSVTGDGFASDPINVAIVATKSELKTLMHDASWLPADPITFASVAKTIGSFILGRHYPTAPMSNLYLLGKRQDESWQQPILDRQSSRHHVRFWGLTLKQAYDLHILPDDLLGAAPQQRVWIGAASLDLGVSFVRYTFQVTHLVDADVNAERDYLVSCLKRSDISERHTVRITKPYSLPNIRRFRGSLESDGKLRLMVVSSGTNQGASDKSQ